MGLQDTDGERKPVPAQCVVRLDETASLLDDASRPWVRPPLEHDGSYDPTQVTAALLVPPAGGYRPSVDLDALDLQLDQR